MKRLGPDLKVPDLDGLKVPAILADVYYDLRDRRLLPLIALVVVAIVAVPFLLGSDPETPPPPSVTGEAGGKEETAAANFAVVEAKPGLRAPGKRLDARTPTNPFKQRYTSLPEEAKLESTSVSSSVVDGGGPSEAVGGDVEAEGTAPADPGAGSGGGAASPPSGPDGDGLRFFAFRPDVRFGLAGSGELSEYKELPQGTLLPERNPVVAFLAVSETGKRALFDISTEVAMVKGPGHCIGGPQSCSLLSLKEGQAADILTGNPDRTFRLKLERIEFVEVKRPKPAGSSSTSSRRGWGFDLVHSFSK
jgi:hypothetical protein